MVTTSRTSSSVRGVGADHWPDWIPATTASVDASAPRLANIVAGRIGTPGPVRPLFEPGAPAIVTEPDDPQIPVFLPHRVPVTDFGPDHRRGTVDGKDLRGHGEDLAGPFPCFVPHPLDRVQAGNRLFVRGLKVGGITSEQAAEAVCPGCPPAGLIACQPPAHHRAVGHLPHGARKQPATTTASGTSPEPGKKPRRLSS